MTMVDWYFDFISPYAYFGWPLLKGLPAEAEVRYQPILLAGLLNHWGQKGPAEIPPKRVWTYRACVWWAKQHGVPFRMPAAHPFNSLPYLRLCIAAGNTPTAIQTIFEALWTTGADPADPGTLAALVAQLGVPPERLAEAGVKEALRANTAEAVQRGVGQYAAGLTARERRPDQSSEPSGTPGRRRVAIALTGSGAGHNDRAKSKGCGE